MLSYAERLDRFVRWFFASSPSAFIDGRLPEPDPVTSTLHKGLVIGCALLALLVLAVFYSVVSGAVERAATRRADQVVYARVSHATQIAAPASRRATPLATRSLLLAGSSN